MEHKSSMDEVERHYIGNILSEEQEPENEFSEALKQKVPESDLDSVHSNSMDSNTTSLLFDAWTTKASKVPELAPSQIVHDEDYYGYVVADAHNKLQQQFQPTSHNIYQFPAQLPAGPQFQQAAQAQLFAVVKLGDTTTMAHLPHHQQEPPPPYSVFAPADQQMFYPPSHQFPLSPHQQAAFFGGGCGGSNLQNLLNEAQQQAMKQICDGGSQRQHIPKLSAIRFDGAPETAAAVTGENLWSNRVRSTAAEQQQQPRKPGQRHSNKHKSTAKEDQPQQKKQHPLSILKKPVTTTTTVEGLQIASAPQTPNRPIGFNPIEPVDKKKVNSGKSLIEQKEDNQQKAKLSDAFQKVTNTVTNNMGNKIRKTKATTVKVISVAQANIGQNAASDESKNLKLNAPSSRFEVLSRIGSRSSPEKPTMETDEGIDEKKRANSITGTGISESTTANRRNQEVKKQRQAKFPFANVFSGALRLLELLVMFMPRTLFGEEAQHSGAGRGNGTSRKATQKCLKNASITEKAIMIIGWLFYAGCAVVYGLVTWFGMLILNIVTMSVTAARLSIKKAFRRIRFPAFQQQHRPVVRNGRLRYEYYG